MATVKDFLNISEKTFRLLKYRDQKTKKARGKRYDTYWENCLIFLKEKLEMDIIRLTEDQKRWLWKIKRKVEPNDPVIKKIIRESKAENKRRSSQDEVERQVDELLNSSGDNQNSDNTNQFEDELEPVM